MTDFSDPTPEEVALYNAALAYINQQIRAQAIVDSNYLHPFGVKLPYEMRGHPTAARTYADVVTALGEFWIVTKYQHMDECIRLERRYKDPNPAKPQNPGITVA